MEGVQNSSQPFKYNGKELDIERGLNLYDYMARCMDAALGRFTTVDPLAEKYYSISPYVYCGNNPIDRIDPTGMDWYRSKEGNVIWRRDQDEEYEDEDGNIWSNIRAEYLFVRNERAILFQQTKNEKGELILRTTSLEAINESQAKHEANVEAAYDQLSSSTSRKAEREWSQKPTLGNWIKFCFTETLGQYSDPRRVVGGLSAGIAGYSATISSSTKITIGQNANATYHAFRHIDKLGLSRSSVSSVIVPDLRSIASGIKVGQHINRIVSVNGKTLQYTAYRLLDGTLNIGKTCKIEKLQKRKRGF